VKEEGRKIRAREKFRPVQRAKGKKKDSATIRSLQKGVPRIIERKETLKKQEKRER